MWYVVRPQRRHRVCVLLWRLPVREEKGEWCGGREGERRRNERGVARSRRRQPSRSGWPPPHRSNGAALPPAPSATASAHSSQASWESERPGAREQGARRRPHATGDRAAAPATGASRAVAAPRLQCPHGLPHTRARVRVEQPGVWRRGSSTSRGRRGGSRPTPGRSIWRPLSRGRARRRAVGAVPPPHVPKEPVPLPFLPMVGVWWGECVGVETTKKVERCESRID